MSFKTIGLNQKFKTLFIMKKLFTLLFFGLLLGFSSLAQVKIGLPAGAAQSSAVLDLSNTGDGTRAFILPTVSNTGVVALPVQGMLVFDLSTSAMKIYQSGAWVSYSTSGSTPAVAVNCSSSAINGYYTQGVANTVSDSITVVVANNSFSAVTLTPVVGDIALTGPGAAGMAVTSFSPASVSPGTGGGTSTITYFVTGTPTTVGSFTATWTKLSLSCAKTGAVCLAIAPITVSNVTNPATLPSTTAAGNTVTFTAAGGTPNTGLTWVMTSVPATGQFSNASTGTGATAQAVLMAGASAAITVTYSATNACGLTVIGTQTANVNNVVVNCATSAINGIYTQNAALTGTNTVTMIVTNQGNAAKTVTPAIGDIILSGAGSAGITVASVSAPVSVAAGASSTLTYTLGGTPTATGAFAANWSNLSMTCVQNSNVCVVLTPLTVSTVNNPTTLPSPTIAGNTITFTAAGGTGFTSLTWAMTSSIAGTFTNTASGTGTSAVATLAAAAAGTITVIFTATNACGTIVTGTQTYNFDALRSALVAGSVGGVCSSCAAYDAAASNTWVAVTAAEYAQIDNFIPVNIAGNSESIMSTVWTQFGTSASSISTGSNTVTLPANNYVVAASVVVGGNIGSQTGGYIKYSTNSGTGFSMSGPLLSVYNTNASGTRIYNILKKPSSVINSSLPTYVAIYGGSFNLGYVPSTATTTYVIGDVSDLTTNTYPNSNIQYQVKGTATKRW